MPNITYYVGDIVSVNKKSDAKVLDLSQKLAVIIDDTRMLILQTNERRPSSMIVSRADYTIFPVNPAEVEYAAYELKLVIDAALTVLGIESPFKK